MSNTRKAESGKPFRQERYASSVEFERGLMANLVARRCAVLNRAEDRELIYFLQLRSHQEDGLRGVVAALLASFPQYVGTRTMHELGMKPGQIYKLNQAKLVRAELPDRLQPEFPLAGDADLLDIISHSDDEEISQRIESARANRNRRALMELPDILGNRPAPRDPEAVPEHPESYPASRFLEACQHAAETEFESDLKKLCLDPSLTVAGKSKFAPWYFPRALDALREHMAEWVAARRRCTVVTALGQTVYDVIDFTMETKCLTLIDGQARTGKTFSAQAKCALHPGRLRYVQVPSSNDEIGFYRAIARSIGVSINLNSKAQELRGRIEEALQRGHLAVVFDEAHYLWPNSTYRDALPNRINWIMTALVNHGVPVCLVTTPQFLRTQKALESRSHWTSEQFIGRIGHYEKLPDSLAESDLAKVAESLLPEGDDLAIEILVRYAQSSAKYLAGIESAVRRARFLAARAGRKQVSPADIKRAIQESVIPSDSALSDALAAPIKASRKGGLTPRETAIKPTGNAPAPVRIPSRAARGMSPAPAAEKEFTGNTRETTPRIGADLVTA